MREGEDYQVPDAADAPDPVIATDDEGDQLEIDGMGADPDGSPEGGDMANDPGEDDWGEDVF